MDYRALAELVMMSLFGLSSLVVAVGFSVRVFLAPTLRELFGKKDPSTTDLKVLAARLGHVEDRLESMESSLTRLAEAKEFDRELEATPTRPPAVGRPKGS